MNRIRINTGLAIATLAIFGLSACGSTNSNNRRLEVRNAETGERVVKGNIGSSGAGGVKTGDEGIFLSGNQDNRVSLMTREHWDPLYNKAKQNKFLELRCIKLGKALALLESKSASKRALGREEIAILEGIDAKQTRDWKRANPNKPVQGLVIPRYISAELEKPRAEQDIEFLARRGRLLQEAYRLENLNKDVWEEVRLNMMREGQEGREFLAVNLIRRLATPQPVLVRFIQSTLSDYVAKESIPYLIAATFTDNATSTGVFPKRTAETLALIGPQAVPEILKVWKNKDGKHLPVNDKSYRVRRYLAPTLGYIGDARAVRPLMEDLADSRIKNDTSKFIYDQVLVEALGNLRDESALGVIKKAWAKYFEAEDFSFSEVAVVAVRKITGKTYETPHKIK